MYFKNLLLNDPSPFDTLDKVWNFDKNRDEYFKRRTIVKDSDVKNFVIVEQYISIGETKNNELC